MKICLTTLNENTASSFPLIGEWGLSILVEVDNLKILLDTGQNIAVVHNAALMGIDLSQIDKIVLSHGHSDHTGGLWEVLNRIRLQGRTERKVEIIAHPDVWASKYGRISEEKYIYVGIPFQKEELENLGASFTLTKDPVWLSENVVTTGEIPMTTEYEQIEPLVYVKEGNEFHPDPLWDDQAIIIKSELGLVVVLGCCHRGIINTLHHAQKLTGVEQIYAVIGGMHLQFAVGGTDVTSVVATERLDRIIAELKKFDIQRIGPFHCTGPIASIRLAQEFGEGFFFNNAGTRVTIP